MNKSDSNTNILFEKIYPAVKLLYELKTDKGEDIVNGFDNIIIPFVILSYKRFDDVITYNQ